MFIDQNRRAPASAAQLLARGVDLLPEGAPPADTPKPAPMTAAERQRKRRAVLKAAKEAKDTKENSNVRSTGRNGHQDAAEGKAEAPKPNNPTGARKAPPQGIRPSSRKARKTASCQAKQGRALPTSPPATVESEKLMRCV